MPNAIIPNNSVVISTQEYERLLIATRTLENIEAKKRSDEHHAWLDARSYPFEAIFETKDGIRAPVRVPAGPPKDISRPCFTSPELNNLVSDASPTATIRNYKLLRFDHDYGKFLYREV